MSRTSAGAEMLTVDVLSSVKNFGVRSLLAVWRAMPKIATFVLVVAWTCSAPSMAAEVSRADAVAIALREAGCRKAEDCDVRGGFRDGKWVFVVWFVMGRNADGSPQFAPGGWVGLTLNAQGVVIDRMPGA